MTKQTVKQKTTRIGLNLLQATKNPEKIVRQSDLWVIIRDQFPKVSASIRLHEWTATEKI